MHRLHRDPAPPIGLTKYRHGQDTWSNTCPTQAERAAIWDKLVAMQGNRCAYCEGQICENQREIEHFRQRSRYPQGTFDWANLFGSCKRAGTCGDHKDKCGAYPPDVLIKPDVEDPEAFFVFTPLGAIRPRANLKPRDRYRAEQTIRVLGLNGALNQIRRSAVAGYIQFVEELAEWAEALPEEDWLQLLQEELQNTAHLPFATAIRHVLTRQSETA